MQLKISQDEFLIAAANDTKLAELSFAIQEAIMYFVGSGVWRWEMARYKLEDKSVKIICRPLVPTKGLQVSNITQLGGLFKMGLLPLSIPKVELFEIGGDRKVAQDGNSRVYQSSEGTLLVQRDIVSDITLGFLAYGLADSIVAWFMKGARTVRWQCSKDIMQTLFSLGMTPGEVTEFYAKDQDYNEKTTVNDLP